MDELLELLAGDRRYQRRIQTSVARDETGREWMRTPSQSRRIARRRSPAVCLAPSAARGVGQRREHTNAPSSVRDRLGPTVVVGNVTPAGTTRGDRRLRVRPRVAVARVFRWAGRSCSSSGGAGSSTARFRGVFGVGNVELAAAKRPVVAIAVAGTAGAPLRQRSLSVCPT